MHPLILDPSSLSYAGQVFGFILDPSSLSYAGQVFELSSSVGTGLFFDLLSKCSTLWTHTN